MSSSTTEVQLGVPALLLREAEGQKITVASSTGEFYSGKLVECEGNMNLCLSDVKVTLACGTVVEMENVYVKGTKIRYIQLPDMLKNSGVFRMDTRGRGRGRGGGRGFGRGGGGRGGGGRPRYQSRPRY